MLIGDSSLMFLNDFNSQLFRVVGLFLEGQAGQHLSAKWTVTGVVVHRSITTWIRKDPMNVKD